MDRKELHELTPGGGMQRSLCGVLGTGREPPGSRRRIPEGAAAPDERHDWDKRIEGKPQSVL